MNLGTVMFRKKLLEKCTPQLEKANCYIRSAREMYNHIYMCNKHSALIPLKKPMGPRIKKAHRYYRISESNTCLFLSLVAVDHKLVGGFNPSEKIWVKNGFIFPNFRGEHKKICELPPPSKSGSDTVTRQIPSETDPGCSCWCCMYQWLQLIMIPKSHCDSHLLQSAWRSGSKTSLLFLKSPGCALETLKKMLMVQTSG